MHGSPIAAHDLSSGPGKHPYFFQIPPDSNIIIVMTSTSMEQSFLAVKKKICTYL